MSTRKWATPAQRAQLHAEAQLVGRARGQLFATDAAPPPAPASAQTQSVPAAAATFPAPTPAINLVSMPHRFLPVAMAPSQNPMIVSKLELVSLGLERVEGQHFIWHLQMTNHTPGPITLAPIAAALVTPDGATRSAAFQIPIFGLMAEEGKDLPLMFTAPNAPGTPYRLLLTSEPAQVTWEPWNVSLA